MVPDASVTCLGLEYFCSAGDDLWSQSDEELVALAAREVEAIGLLERARVVDATVLRVHKASPVYDDGFQQALDCVRSWTDRLRNLQLVGRNGMHKYNNQDHAMMTAMLCARNIVAGRQVYDLWQVNQDAEYHEGGTAGEVKSFGLRTVPARAR